MRVTFFTTVLLLTHFLQAQRTLPSDTFRIVKAYQPTLVDAEKIYQEAEINDTFKIDPAIEYHFIIDQVPVQYTPELIPAARIKGEPLVKLYHGYAKVGVGNALMPDAHLYYSSLRSKEFALGGEAHFRNQKELEKIPGSDFTDWSAGLNGKKFWPSNTFSSSLAFQQRQFNYYGWYQLNDEKELEVPELEQRYSRIKADFELATTKTDSFNLRHLADLSFRSIANQSGDMEHNFVAGLNLSKFHNRELYNIDIGVDYNTYEEIWENTIVSIAPRISTIGDKFRVDAGLGIFVNATSEADFHFYPQAEIKYNVLEEVIIPYIGINGGIERNNYYRLTKENPFVYETHTFRNQNLNYDGYAGIRGMLSSAVSFNVNGSFSQTENDYFFIKPLNADLRMAERFALVYDDIQTLRLKGEIGYRQEALHLFLVGEYFNFDTESLERAWHRPELKITTTANYNLRDKIIVKADLFYWGEQYAPLYSAELSQPALAIETLDPIFDANLGFEYRYTKRLSAYLNFNNIGGIRYEKYQDYPVQGFNVLGGFTYGF
jgi:hypothetical protein